MKKLMEERAKHQADMKALLSKAKEEERAMSEEELQKFEELEGKIANIDATLTAMEKERAIEPPKADDEEKKEDETKEEERAFADFILGKASELRAGEVNLDMGNNGAVIPATIADRIIKAVKDRCPIFAKATIYNVKGTLKIPVWGDTEDGHNIAVGYQKEFTEITADSGKFTTVDLGGYLAGALTLIGKSVENNGTFSVVDFVVNQMAEDIAAFIEKELLTGTGENAAEGALNTKNVMTAAAQSVITADELIDLQAKVKQAFQKDACWTMHPETFAIVKKLKDGENRYLLQNDISGEFPYTLLGKPVYVSDNMPKMTAGAKAILYGDYSGLSVNLRENISVEVLREKYATMHAVGVNAWFEFDAKVTEEQKLACLKMAG